MCLNWLILKFFLGTIIFLNNCKTHLMMFLKGNLRPILWSLGSLWGTQISQNKLRSALFLRTNEKKHTVHALKSSQRQCSFCTTRAREDLCVQWPHYRDVELYDWSMCVIICLQRQRGPWQPIGGKTGKCWPMRDPILTAIISWGGYYP